MSISTTDIQNLWFDAFTLAANLVTGNIAVEVVPGADNTDLPLIRTRQNFTGPVVVEIWPTDDGANWHAYSRRPLLVLPVDQNPRTITAAVARLHWQATA